MSLCGRRGRPAAWPAWALLLVFLLVFASPRSAVAGPWVPEPGEGYAKVWLKWLPGLGYHGGDGRTHGYGGYNELFLAAYVEVGLVEGLSLQSQVDLVRIFSLDDTRGDGAELYAAPGDPSVGLRLALVEAGRFRLSAELGLTAPLARDEVVQAVHSDAPGQPRIGGLRVGAGVWDLREGLSFGYGWDSVYLAGAVAFVLRSGGYDDAVAWSAEVGGELGAGFAGRARVTGYHALRNGSEPRDESPSGIGNGTTYTGLALEADYEVASGAFVGVTLEGGLLGIRRQTGGPVISLYGALRF